MRGLNTFITDIRNCQNKEAEQRRCEKELAKVRNKYASQKGLSGYHRKKYAWKLLYMYILGYDIEFGYQESANLINSNKYTEKYAGYITTSLLTPESCKEIYAQVTHSIRNDLKSSNDIYTSLALAMLGGSTNRDLCENLKFDIVKLALEDNQRSIFVKKKALLCLLRIYRKYKEIFDISAWAVALSSIFDHRQLGLLLAATSFLLGIIQISGPSGFEELTPKVVKILDRLVIQNDCPQEYLYYRTPNPWLQVRCLKLLQYFDPDPQFKSSLNTILTKILKNTEVTKSVNKNNTDHGILFEAVSVIIHYRNYVNTELRNQAIDLLGVFISVKEPNIRYLALDCMTKMNQFPNVEIIIQQHLKTILNSLKDNDVSIKRRALDILYLMCTPETSKKIVEELLTFTAEADLQIKEELVLKIAILAERFADSLVWYIDVIIKLIQTSGDYITDDIWQRVIQIITGFGVDQDPELQRYATLKIYTALNLPHIHETLIRIGSYVLAEYGKLIVDQNRTPEKIFEILQRHFVNVSESGKAMLLSAFTKLSNQFPELKDQTQSILEIHTEHWDPDLQQRAVEYLEILRDDSDVSNIRSVILQKMPCYSEQIQANNPLVKKIFELKTGDKNKDATLDYEKKKMLETQMDPYATKSNMASSASFSTSKSDADSLSATGIPAHLKENPLFELCKGKVAYEVPNVQKVPDSIKSMNIKNINEFKTLVSTPTGILFSDNDIQIDYKSEFQGTQGRIAMQFVPKNGLPIQKVNLMVSNSNGLIVSVSAVKYDDNPKVMIQTSAVGPASSIPILTLQFTQDGSNRSFDVALPIVVTKFISPVDIPIEQFTKFFNEYTTSKNASYYRLDSFIKNPAPRNIPVSEVLKKFGSLLNTCLNLKGSGLPDLNNLKLVYAAGQYQFKPENSEQPKNLPVMVEVEGFQENPDYLRLSLRGAGTGDIIKNLYQFIMMYLGN